MLLNDLVQPTPNDIILREAMLTSKNTLDSEYITEFLPLIPLALWGAGAAWTAYDAYQAKKAYDRDEISGAELTKMVGTDIAITLAAGGVAKIVGKGWKFGKKLYKSKNAAKAAEKSAMSSAAAAVNNTVKTQIAKADITKEIIGEIIGFNKEEKSEAINLVCNLTGDNSRDVVSFGTEAGLFQEIGISTAVCGPGSIEQAHKVDEFIKLEEINKCLKFLDGIKNKTINL